MDYQKLFKNKLDRRRLLGNLGMMGAGAVITACGAGAVTPEPEPQPEPTPDPNLDAAILNFALNLEYLEAAFYLAAVGRISEINTVGGDAEVILPEGFDGTSPIEGLSSSVMAYAEELASEELAHVLFLRSALEAAGAPVADRPVLDLSTSFVAAAQAAFDLAGITEPPFPAAAFNPFAAEPFFLHGAFIFEDVGVTAYKGAARFLTNKDFLEAAAGILAAEAYHSGNIRTVLYNAAEAGAYDGLPIFAIVQAISDARDALGNPDVDQDQAINDVDIVTSSSANIAVTDANGIAFSRTPASVAAIVYLNAEAMPGGFFPNGITVPAGLEEDFNSLLAL
jgi:hypothetical protein